MNDCHSPYRDLYIAYTLLDFLTPARLRILRESFPTPERLSAARTSEVAALLRLPDDRAKLVKNPLHIPDISNIVTEWRNRAITLIDDGYSTLLREIPDPPPALYLRGNRDLLARPSIGIVGSRRASRYGLAVSEHLGRELSRIGVTVVSGLARGIDQAAHHGALGAEGSTIAVLGTGIDVDYPRGSQKLREAIAEKGLIVTELPPGSPPRPSNFPVRNRIISGLSLGVIVVEATDKSGSLITARMAAEQNREVFAVPGSIFANGSEGPNRLIQYGAKLVHDLDDILDELQIDLAEKSATSAEQACLDGLAARVWDAITIDEPTHVDTLALRLEVRPGQLSTALLELEIEGRIRSVPGGMWVRSPVSRESKIQKFT